MTEKLLFGSDPEFFYLERNRIVPPLFLLGEGKRIIWKSDFPYRVYEEVEDIAVTSDGAAFELVVDPAENWEELFKRIQAGIQLTESLVDGDGFKKGIVPAALLPKKYLVDETLVTGCDPDYDALRQEWFAKETIEDSPYRYAGAHIHLGFVENDMRQFAHDNIIPLAQLLGIYVGIPSVLYSDEKEREELRMKKYGKPAKYRIPEHGIEYRSTSNNWIKNIELAATLFENIQKVVEVFKDPNKGGDILDRFLSPLSDGFKNNDYELLETAYNDAIKLI